MTLECRTSAIEISVAIAKLCTRGGGNGDLHYMNVTRVAKQSFEGPGDRERGPEASGKGGRFWT